MEKGAGNNKKEQNNLAIVIPAYRKTFFKEVLESIANQTNKNFTLYIGDDCSPDDLYSIVKEYENRIEIVYKHFDENFGGKDLVAHWNRCIDLTKNEEWVWLFSDDDIMENNCVEEFFFKIEQEAKAYLYHFDLVRIDEFNNVLSIENKFPNHFTAVEFLYMKMTNRINSYVVEYIFNKDQFYNKGCFQKFDLAWGSDQATWVKLSLEKGIISIPSARVKWRNSGGNISANNYDKLILTRKINANISFFEWAKNYFHDNSISFPLSKFQSVIWFLNDLEFYITKFGYNEITEWLSLFFVTRTYLIYKFFAYLHMLAYTVYYYSLKNNNKQLMKWQNFKNIKRRFAG